jgi:hypothetical protein
VINQNRISNAARASTRFAANGGEDKGMVNVIINSVTQTLKLEEDVWDIYSLRASFNEAGTGFKEWEFEHIYGISATQRISEVNQFDIQARVLDELEIDHDGNRIVDTELAQELGDLRIVGTYIIYDMDSILGLDATPAVSQIYSVAQLNVMRMTGIQVQPTNGCAAFPISVSRNIASLTPPNEGREPFPAPGNFDFPLPPPTYGSFPGHMRDVTLDDAPEGTVFRVRRGNGSGNFNWLVWNQGIVPDALTLSNSLRWPGDSLDYSNHGDNGTAASGEYPHVVRGYVEPGNSTNLDLNIGDLVMPTTAQLPGIATAVNGLIDKDIRVITWTEKDGGFDLISRFAVFKIQGYGDSGTDNEWLLLEFVRWDDSCGQILAGGA